MVPTSRPRRRALFGIGWWTSECDFGLALRWHNVRVALLRHPEKTSRAKALLRLSPTRVGDVREAAGSQGTAGADSIIPAGQKAAATT